MVAQAKIVEPTRMMVDESTVSNVAFQQKLGRSS